MRTDADADNAGTDTADDDAATKIDADAQSEFGPIPLPLTPISFALNLSILRACVRVWGGGARVCTCVCARVCV